MMDPRPIFPNGFHPCDSTKNFNWKGSPKTYDRTHKPPKYYLIDFGLSQFYDPEQGPMTLPPILGADKSVPEYQGEGEFIPHDPYPVDVYYLGSMIKVNFIKVGVFLVHFYLFITCLPFCGRM